MSGFAERERLFRRAQKVLVAVSGGPDSVAALLVMQRLARQLGFEVVVSSFDHKLRPESAADLDFVRDLCAKLGVPCKTGEGDVRDAARQSRTGIEDAARTMRYQFLGFVAANERADCIVTGHTADDQAETVLLHIARGSGIRGVRGMLPAGPLPGSAGQRLVRPLLVLRRDETVAICAEAGITPVDDASNYDRSHVRNQVRHSAMDELGAINPAIGDALVGLAASAREAFRPIERQADMAVPLERGPFGSTFATTTLAALPGEGLTLVIEREASFYRSLFAVNRTMVENARAMLARGTGKVAFGGTLIEASCGVARIVPSPVPEEPVPTAVLNVPGITKAGQWVVAMRVDPFPQGTTAASAAIDISSMKGALRLRPIAVGDRMHHNGKTKLLSDVLAAARVPRWERPTMLAIADSTGVLAAIGGYHSVSNAGGVPEDNCLYVGLSRIP